MPPLIPVKKDEVEILDEMPEMIGFTQSKYVFTDISYGVSDRVSQLIESASLETFNYGTKFFLPLSRKELS